MDLEEQRIQSKRFGSAQPFPFGEERAFFMDHGSHYSSFHRWQQVKGFCEAYLWSLSVKPLNISPDRLHRRGPRNKSDKDFCATRMYHFWGRQCVPQAWPLERFWKGGVFYQSVLCFLHCHNHSAAPDLHVLKPLGSLWLSHLSTCRREPCLFPCWCPIQPNAMQFGKSTFLGKTASPDLQAQSDGDFLPPQVTCSDNELRE